MRIVRLQAENVKRLKAVTYRPTGNTIVVGGKNSQGKTSLLDSIAMAMSWRDNRAELPVRVGAGKAEVVLDLGDLVVTRKWRRNGSTSLVVTGKDGRPYPSPQAMLDRLFGDLTFDPLAFARAGKKEQAEILRKLVEERSGFNFEAAGIERTALYSERQGINREIKTYQGQLAGMPVHKDIERLDLIDLSEITKQYDAAHQHNQRLDEAVQSIRINQDQVDTLNDEILDLERDIAALRKRREQALKRRDAINESTKQFKTEVENTPRLPVDDLQDKLAAATEHNKRVEQVEARKAQEKLIEERQTHANELTRKMDQIEAEQAAALSKEGVMPIDGLVYDYDQVVFNGVPFDQLGMAERIKVSCAMGAALNPELKVLLVRDGAFLDEDNLAVLAQIADEHNMQIWIEVVGDNAAVSVIIEDGELTEKGQ